MLNRTALNLLTKRSVTRASTSNHAAAVALFSQQQIRTKFDASLNQKLEVVDPEMFDIIEHEKRRQFTGLQLIPSEVCVLCC